MIWDMVMYHHSFVYQRRDFVSLRVKVVRPGQYMSLGTAVIHESKPPQPHFIR